MDAIRWRRVAGVKAAAAALLLFSGILFICRPAAAAPAAPAFSPAPASSSASPASSPADPKTGRPVCALCHERICREWVGTTHELAGRRAEGGFRCRECHRGGLLHPGGVSVKASVDQCGRCHGAPSAGPADPGGVPSGTALDWKGWAASGHARGQLGCTTCHSVHQAAEGADRRLLKKAGDKLCLDCHKGVAHNGRAGEAVIARRPCIACHDPHGAQTSLLDARRGGEKGDFRKAAVHEPVARGQCAACHSPHVVGPGWRPPEDELLEEEEPSPGVSRFKGLLLAPGRTFCYLCHGEYRTPFEATAHTRVTRFRHGEEQSPCLGCHLPHASDYPKLARYPGNQLCLACHPGYAPHHFLARGGVKDSELACTRCHRPHGSGRRRLLIQEDLCRLCHPY